MDNPLDLNSRAWETTKEAAIANTLASSTAQMIQLNAALKARYDSQFDSFKVMVDGGKIPNTNPPQVPNGYQLVTDANGFAFAEPGGPPVCVARTDIPPDRSKTQAELDAIAGPNVIKIGVHLYGASWQSMTGDTCGDGFKTPPMPPGKDFPGGSVFQKVMSPWGGWWLKVQ